MSSYGIGITQLFWLSLQPVPRERQIFRITDASLPPCSQFKSYIRAVGSFHCRPPSVLPTAPVSILLANSAPSTLRWPLRLQEVRVLSPRTRRAPRSIAAVGVGYVGFVFLPWRAATLPVGNLDYGDMVLRHVYGIGENLLRAVGSAVGGLKTRTAHGRTSASKSNVPARRGDLGQLPRLVFYEYSKFFVHSSPSGRAGVKAIHSKVISLQLTVHSSGKAHSLLLSCTLSMSTRPLPLVDPLRPLAASLAGRLRAPTRRSRPSKPICSLSWC